MISGISGTPVQTGDRIYGFMIRSYQGHGLPVPPGRIGNERGQPTAIAYAPAQTTRKASATDERWSADYPRLHIGRQLRAPIPAVRGAALERQSPLRVFGCLPVSARGAARRQASEKPRRRKPRGEYAPAAVSVYGDLRRGFCATWPVSDGTAGSNG